MNENMRVKKGEELEVLTGKRLKAYQKIEDGMSLKQMKIARVTTKGLLKKKMLSIGRLYKNSNIPENQEKYKKWLDEVEKLENEVIRWDLVIDKRKQDDERNKETQKK